MRPSRRRQALPTVEQLIERFDDLARNDVGYRRLTVAVRRALSLLQPLLDKRALARHMALEEAMNARDVYSTDAVAQWAYSLGFRDGATPLRPARVRKRVVRRLTRLRRARTK
jgi:hypothetical protein